MGGLSHALWLWLPVLIYKAVSAVFSTIWKFNLWTLQTISGVPLYYAKPEYRIPGILLGTLGLLISFMLVCTFHLNPLLNSIKIGGIAAGLLIACRWLVRKGSL